MTIFLWNNTFLFELYYGHKSGTICSVIWMFYVPNLSVYYYNIVSMYGILWIYINIKNAHKVTHILFVGIYWQNAKPGTKIWVTLQLIWNLKQHSVTVTALMMLFLSVCLNSKYCTLYIGIPNFLDLQKIESHESVF